MKNTRRIGLKNALFIDINSSKYINKTFKPRESREIEHLKLIATDMQSNTMVNLM